MRAVAGLLIPLVLLGGPLEAGQLTTEAALDALYAEFTKAYETLDASRVAALYEEDAFYLQPGEPPPGITRGRGRIGEGFARFFDSVKAGGGSLTIAFRIVDRQVSAGLATDIGYYRLTSATGGQASHGYGKFIVVARRQADGGWKFHADGYSGAKAADWEDAAAIRRSGDSGSRPGSCHLDPSRP